MTFYKLLKPGRSRDIFKEELYKYVAAWEQINIYIQKFGDSFIEAYSAYKTNKIGLDEFKCKIENLFRNKIVPFNGLFKENFCISQQGLLNQLKKNLISKLKRTKEKVDAKNKFSDSELKKNIESAFRSGFYTHFRSIMNDAKKGKLILSEAKKIANWYFIREFCYGGMFRFNDKGEFNVPYGGIGYNSKNFRSKVDYIFSNEVRHLLTNTITENKDFEELINSLNLTKKDFMFLDPPYDTEFSEYEENSFTKRDQERLARALVNLTAKWVLIIKETNFIKGLYTNKNGIHMSKFSKSYLFNIKKRNERDVNHLIIHNLDEAAQQQTKLTNHIMA